MISRLGWAAQPAPQESGPSPGPPPPPCLPGAALPRGHRMNKLLLLSPKNPSGPQGRQPQRNLAGATTWGTGGRRR